MKKTLLAALYLCITFCLFVAPVCAAEIKVGILNSTKVISDSKAGKSAQVVFNKELDTKKAALAVKQKELQAMQDELSSKASTMTASDYNDKVTKFNKTKKELERLKSEMEEELKLKNTELNRKLSSEILAIVSDYRKKENYTLILENTNVVVYDNAVDITDKIVQLYDASKETTTK